MLRVRVPATLANLGPGFDALGLAVNLYCEAQAEPQLEDRFEYNGDSHLFDNENLMHQGWREAHRALGLVAPKVSLRCQSQIPLARGLGSSSAALVAGAALADAAMGGSLGRDGVLRVCAALEGHPDNVAPAVLGGFTASVMTETGPLCSAFVLPEGLHILVAVPSFELKTTAARAALPEQYSRADMVYNLSRSALWVAAIAQNRLELLREACQDRLHQPYRAPLVPRLEPSIRAALDAGALAAFLSGAGPSLAALVREAHLSVVQASLSEFAALVLQLRPSQGYELLEVNQAQPEAVPLGG